MHFNLEKCFNWAKKKNQFKLNVQMLPLQQQQSKSCPMPLLYSELFDQLFSLRNTKALIHKMDVPCWEGGGSRAWVHYSKQQEEKVFLLLTQNLHVPTSICIMWLADPLVWSVLTGPSPPMTHTAPTQLTEYQTQSQRPTASHRAPQLHLPLGELGDTLRLWPLKLWYWAQEHTLLCQQGAATM